MSEGSAARIPKLQDLILIQLIRGLNTQQPFLKNTLRASLGHASLQHRFDQLLRPNHMESKRDIISVQLHIHYQDHTVVRLPPPHPPRLPAPRGAGKRKREEEQDDDFDPYTIPTLYYDEIDDENDELEYTVSRKKKTRVHSLIGSRNVRSIVETMTWEGEYYGSVPSQYQLTESRTSQNTLELRGGPPVGQMQIPWNDHGLTMQ